MVISSFEIVGASGVYFFDQPVELNPLIVLPFLFYVGNKVFCEKFTIGEMILLMVTMFAAASASLMSLGIAPVMLLAIAFLNAIQKHRFMILLQAGICCVPAAIYLGMYVISILTTFGGW